LRDGKPKTVAVTIEEQPTNYGLASREESSSEQPRSEIEERDLDKIGLHIADLTPDLAERFGYKPEAKGVVVTRVSRDGVASEAGMAPGMLIHSINKKTIASADKAKAALEKASLEKGILLQVEYPPNIPGAGGSMTYLLLKAEPSEK
jgi:serine protease Do